MARKAHVKALEEFKATQRLDNLFISLCAAGVNLILTSASGVFMMDPWLSWAIEAQELDRVRKIGQIYEVRAMRFIVRSARLNASDQLQMQYCFSKGNDKVEDSGYLYAPGIAATSNYYLKWPRMEENHPTKDGLSKRRRQNWRLQGTHNRGSR